jgi:hypothetical protein
LRASKAQAEERFAAGDLRPSTFFATATHRLMSRNDALGKSITAALRKSFFGVNLEL